MKNRIFFRLLGTYLIITLLSVAVVYLFISEQIKQTSVMKSEETLNAFAQIVDRHSRKEITELMAHLAQASRARVTVIDAAGRVVADSMADAERLDNHFNRPEIQEARVKGQGRNIRYSQTLGADMLYVAFPIKSGEAIEGYVRLALPMIEAKQSMKKLHQSLLISSLMVFLVAVLMAVAFSYHLAAPIKEMEMFTEKLRKGEAPGALLIRPSNEMKQLAGNINYLFEELQNRIRTADEEKGKLIAAFASMNEGVLVLNQDDRIEIYNRAFHHMIAAEYGDVAGKTLMEAFRNVELHDAFNRFMALQGPVVQEIALGKSPRHDLEVSISGIRIPGEKKTMMVFHDVTRLKKLEKMRVDFVANVTHEIKTPLTAILGFIETLQGGAINNPEEARKFLSIIAEQAQRMNRLLDDLLTLSNIELGEVPFHFEGVSLGPVADNVCAVLEGRIKEKGLTFKRDIPASLPLIRADRDRLVQVLLNTLDNAVKFTPEGGSITLSADTAGEDQAVIHILDTGMGIPQSEIPRIGERFYRVDKTRSRELGGTGLGLSIVKHIMDVHNGRMEIKSQLGRGTTVSLYFPAIYGADGNA